MQIQTTKVYRTSDRESRVEIVLSDHVDFPTATTFITLRVPVHHHDTEPLSAIQAKALGAVHELLSREIERLGNLKGGI